MPHQPGDPTGRVTAQRMAEEFERWYGKRGADAGAVVSDVELLLSWKVDYADADLARWDLSDVHEFLLEWCPRKLSLSGAESATIPESVGAYLSFLAAKGLLAGATASQLAAYARGRAAEFRAAMDDPRNFGMAKSLFAAAGEDGVDLTDPDELQGWIDAFNSRPEDERRAMIPGPAAAPPVFPPVALPAEADVAMSRAAAPVLPMFAALAAYVGEGRKLTAKGNLTRADARALVELLGTGDTVDYEYDGRTHELHSSADLPTLTLVYAWARKAGVLRVAKGRVVATKKGRALALDPGAYFDTALEALLDLGAVSVQWEGGSYWTLPEVNEVLDDNALTVLALLYAEPDPVPFDVVAELGLDLVKERYVIPNATLIGGAVAGRIASMLDAFVLGGVVQRDDVPEPDEAWPTRTRTGGAVRLTPAGTASTQRLLVEAGADAPVAGAFAAASATELLRGTDAAEYAVFAAETAAWLQAREPMQAAEELAAAAEELEPHLAHAALLLLATGEPSTVGPALRGLGRVPHLRGAVVATLVDLGLEPPDTQYDPSDESWFPDLLLFRLIGDGIESAAGALALVGDRSAQVALLDRLWRQASPATGVVLEALGREHPDKQVAKAARKSSFRHRSRVMTK